MGALQEMFIKYLELTFAEEIKNLTKCKKHFLVLSSHYVIDLEK
jgi:hypothetical protein